MAKLSARGRVKLAQVSLAKDKERDTCFACNGMGQVDNVPCQNCKGEKTVPSSCVWERKTKAYMSDGNLLEKLDVRFRAGPYDHGKDQPHSYGWKVRGKVKAGLTVEAWIEMHKAKGWTVESV